MKAWFDRPSLHKSARFNFAETSDIVFDLFQSAAKLALLKPPLDGMPQNTFLVILRILREAFERIEHHQLPFPAS
jgi:hypothetical protein